MRNKLTWSKQGHHRGVLSTSRRDNLLSERADLKVLIYTMEHDRNINAQLWQVESLKKTLMDIEERIHISPLRMYERAHNRN